LLPQKAINKGVKKAVANIHLSKADVVNLVIALFVETIFK